MPIPTRDHALDPTSNVSELALRALGDAPNTLPLGLFHGEAGHVSTFEWNPPVVRTKKRLGALKARKDLKRHPAKFVSYYLATALSKLGPWDLNALKVEEAARLVSLLSFGDTIYLLFSWQGINQPDGFKLVGSGCGQCGQPFDEVLVDAGSLEVSQLPPTDVDGNPWTATNRPLAVVGLSKGAPFGPETVKTLGLSPAPWNVLWSLGETAFTNPDLRAALMIKGSGCANDANDATVIPDGLVDELWPQDVQAIDNALGLVTPTPDLRIVVPCPNCGAENQDVLDWSRPDFF